MNNYRKIKTTTPRQHPVPKNTIKVSKGGKINEYTKAVAKLLSTSKTVSITGTGIACNKAVSVSEIAKRQSLVQGTVTVSHIELFSVKEVDEWIPVNDEEGNSKSEKMDVVLVERNLPGITITLVSETQDENNAG